LSQDVVRLQRRADRPEAPARWLRRSRSDRLETTRQALRSSTGFETGARAPSSTTRTPAPVG